MTSESSSADFYQADLNYFHQVRTPNQGKITDTWHQQANVEERIFLIRQANNLHSPVVLQREKHVKWLINCIHVLPRHFLTLDAVQGWIGFWIIHSLDLLGAVIPKDTASQLVTHFRAFQDPEGGYGGGPGQCSHLSCTFSALMALCALGTEEALNSINRQALERFILQMKQADGSFRVSQYGETDVRAMYCALAIASIIGSLERPVGTALQRDCAKYISSLQSFDGGLGGIPGAESHGGNTYCGLASSVILRDANSVDTENVLHWASLRQMSYEGGFQGRTNKLVDSCYSFWVGSLFPLISILTGEKGIQDMFDANALQAYLLDFCQLQNGGIRDKPGVGRDLMHTCYGLSGLSIAQHYGGVRRGKILIRRTNPVYNLCEDKFEKAWLFFREDGGQ